MYMYCRCCNHQLIASQARNSLSNQKKCVHLAIPRRQSIGICISPGPETTSVIRRKGRNNNNLIFRSPMPACTAIARECIGHVASRCDSQRFSWHMDSVALRDQHSCRASCTTRIPRQRIAGLHLHSQFTRELDR